ncbi:MAG: S-formylglutathione hydrolase [Bdellovibrio sp.]|nr:S-formylglutathione hydrolase [Bdellovibrio sp.]
MKTLKQHQSFNGMVKFNEHDSYTTGTKMAFSTFVPNTKVKGCLIWLSGLTCTDENFMAKAGAQKYLAENNLMVICPDTSPRGLKLPHEHDHWDFGAGASFYVDATTAGYKDHYKMHSYIGSELYTLVQKEFGVEDRISISGHSMGGHGALTIGLRDQDRFKSISAFSPIVNPTQCPWGHKAFAGYLGDDKSKWAAYDASEMIRSGKSHKKEILIDQGSADNFLKEQLLTNNIIEAANGTNQKLKVRMQEGYDHSYYFIATFIEDHIRFHASHM